MPQLRLRALCARRGRGYVEKQKGRSLMRKFLIAPIWKIKCPFGGEAVCLSAWSALIRLVEYRAFCASQALAACVHACMPQLWLHALCARRGRSYVEKQDGRSPSKKNL